MIFIGDKFIGGADDFFSAVSKKKIIVPKL